MNWWTTKVTTPGKTENEVAEEIQVFRVEGPPPTTRDTAMKFEKSDEDMEEATKQLAKMLKEIKTMRRSASYISTSLTCCLRQPAPRVLVSRKTKLTCCFRQPAPRVLVSRKIWATMTALPLIPQSLLQTSFRPLEKILSKRSQGTLLRGMSSPCNSLVCFLLPKHIMGSIMHPNADACSRHRRSSLFGKITSGSHIIFLQIHNRHQVLLLPQFQKFQQWLPDKT